MKTLTVLLAVLIPVIGSAQARATADDSTPADRLAINKTSRAPRPQPVTGVPSDQGPVASAPTETIARFGNAQTNLVNDDCMIPSGCAAWPTDPASGGSGGTTLCTLDYCFQCALNSNQTKSICYTLLGSSGKCSCEDSDYVHVDQYGQKSPRCTMSGSCAYRR